MKLIDIHEDVVDLSKHRQAKTPNIDNIMSHIDHSVADAVDDLIVSGMSEEDAHMAVMQHLSDIVMASDLNEQEIVPKEKLKSKKLKKLPKMKKVEPPFTKGSFKKLLNVTGGSRIKDPVGGKVIKHI